MFGSQRRLTAPAQPGGLWTLGSSAGVAPGRPPGGPPLSQSLVFRSYW